MQHIFIIFLTLIILLSKSKKECSSKFINFAKKLKIKKKVQQKINTNKRIKTQILKVE